jgi:predicted dehydrogenase
MADKVQIGIIGVGQIGKNHLRRYSEMSDVEVVAAVDVNDGELSRVAEQYGIPNTYAKFRDLLARDDIVAVDVCMHNNLHAPATIAALEAGKHVFCEKPIAGAYADGKAMVEAAKSCGQKLSIQLSTLFSKETKTAKKLIDDGRLGLVYHARSTGYRRRGRPFVDGTDNFVKKAVASGGALFDMGVYHISQMLYLLGQPTMTRISGKIYQETGMDASRRAQSGYDVEELGMGFVRFEDGIVLDLIEAWAIHLNAFEGSYIVGSEGSIRLNPFGFYTTMSDVEMNTTVELNSADTRWHRLNENESAYDSPQYHWISVLHDRVPLLPTAEIALQTMLISEGIYLSGRLGREVTVDEVDAESVSKAIEI